MLGEDMQDHRYTKTQLIDILDKVVDKTFGEVDTAHVFDKTIDNPKITGIAGDVVENSILGYPSDSYQAPDLNVDGNDVELKTTGIRKVSGQFVAKEPMSITAVSPEKITDEKFDTSNFWHKLEKMLIVYYHYNSKKPVPAAEYANFYIKGYDFHVFSDKDRQTLENDWKIVQKFIVSLNEQYGDNAPDQYPRISSEIRNQLMLIDTAPKWPHRPRFRLKRSTVSAMVQEHFGKKLESLNKTYSTYHDLDIELHDLTTKYHGKTIRELMNLLNIPINSEGDKTTVSKSIAEQIISRMFDAKSKKLNKIEDFNKLGIIAKSIVQTKKGTRTEDTKLFKINFDDLLNTNTPFEESDFYNYFNEQQFLCILFEEPNTNAGLLENKFLGFKRFMFSESFIDYDVKKTWSEIRDTIQQDKLVDVIKYNNDGSPKVNSKSQVVISAPNFPKSKTNKIFVRGSGSDSKSKPLVINGVQMYTQYIWIKGKVFLELLKTTEFI